MGRAGYSEQSSGIQSGHVVIGGQRIYARSRWEANVAAYFQFLKENGKIFDWCHEPETFWFLKIKRGVRSYLPDFRITNNDGSSYLVEVKGWMDAKSKTKIARMRKFYPHIILKVIGKDEYEAICTWSSIIPEWGALQKIVIDPADICKVPGCMNKMKDKGFCNKHLLKIYGKNKA